MKNWTLAEIENHLIRYGMDPARLDLERLKMLADVVAETGCGIPRAADKSVELALSFDMHRAG